MLSLMLAAAALTTAVDAENAFIRDAQIKGQWTAFRAYADPDAVLFTPQAVWAHEFLKDRADPPVAVMWWPGESYVSCDGRTAINTGPWVRNGGKLVGYFTTVWQRETGQWRWVYDGGDALAKPRPAREKPFVRKASCSGKAGSPPLMAPPPAVKRAGSGPPDDFGRGQSADGTIGWDWKVEANGARRFRTFLWDGARFEQVVFDRIAGE